MNKRGQITAFVIIGIIIVAASVLVYVNRQSIAQSRFRTAELESVVVPARAESVKQLVDQCVIQVVAEGTDLLGQQGGYIEIPDDSLANSNMNYFSNSLEIFTGAGAKVPYWWYEAASNIEKEQVPSIQKMQLELEKYIDANIKDCIDLSLFTRNGYKFTDTPFTSEV